MAAADLLPLEFKPNFHEAVQRMEAFWAGEIIDRPACGVTAPLPDHTPIPGTFYMEAAFDDTEKVIERAVHNAAATYWGGEAMPAYCPSFGPDMFAAWLGADLALATGDDQHRTSWVVPFVEDWEQAFPLRLDEQGKWWQKMVDFMTRLSDVCTGKMLVSHVDMHSNMDALSAIRDNARLCMDLYDVPELIDEAMRQVRPLFREVYDRLFAAGKMHLSGSQSWIPLYHPGRTLAIQCDYLALIGPEHARRWVLPALEEEAQHLDGCVYHLDGPECLVHLDDLLAIKEIGVIQWVSGAGNKPFVQWRDVFERVQEAGKGLWLYGSWEELQVLFKELRPERCYYHISASSPAEAEAILQWMKDNT